MNDKYSGLQSQIKEANELADITLPACTFNKFGQKMCF